MSEVMTNAIIGMPIELAMHSKLSQEQFYLRAQAVLAENATLKNEVQRITEARRIEWNNAQQVQAERDQVRDLMRTVVAEIPHAKQYKPGNAPGHSHDIAGVWDSDNGAKAGKECAWCKVWNAALAMQEAAQ